GNAEVTQYEADSGDLYRNFHGRDDENPARTPATGGVSGQGAELGTFPSITLSHGAGGAVTLSMSELLSQFGAGGIVFRGTDGADILTGTPSNDDLSGEDGNDVVSGGAGDDTLDGGAGDDILDGGEGNNTFILGFNSGH